MNILSIEVHFENGTTTTITNGGELHDAFGTVINLLQPQRISAADIAKNPKLVEGKSNDPTLMGVPGAFEYQDNWYFPTAYEGGMWTSWFRGVGSPAQPEVALAWMNRQLGAPLTMDRTKYGDDQKKRMGW